MPQWSTNNVTQWTTALDSTPSWNYQRGNKNNNIRCDGWTFCMLNSAIFVSFCQQFKINAKTL